MSGAADAMSTAAFHSLVKSSFVAKSFFSIDCIIRMPTAYGICVNSSSGESFFMPSPIALSIAFAIFSISVWLIFAPLMLFLSFAFASASNTGLETEATVALATGMGGLRKVGDSRVLARAHNVVACGRYLLVHRENVAALGVAPLSASL